MSHVEILTIVAAYAGAVVIGITMAVLVTSSIGGVEVKPNP